MNATSANPVADPLNRLARRIRWKRGLSKLNRFAWAVALGFLLLYAADCLLGWSILSLRIASAVAAVVAIGLLTADMIATWFVKLDRIGLAQILEARYPELAERLVTLVQIAPGASETGFAQVLQAETHRRLAQVKPEDAYSLNPVYKAWCVTFGFFAAVFIGLAFLPSFGGFSHRFFGAWTTPLIPYEITLNHGNGFALRGGEYPIAATIHLLDEHAELPRECRLSGEDDTGSTIELPMHAAGNGRFTVTLRDLQQACRFWIEAGDARSESISLGLMDVPVFADRPTIFVLPPAYAQKNVPVDKLLGDEKAREFEVLRFSKMYYSLPIKDFAGPAHLRVRRMDEASERFFPVLWKPSGVAEAIAAEPGSYQAEVVFKLEHGFTATLPVGQFTVRDDTSPRFAQSLRLHGSDTGLRVNHPYRIAPDAVLKLQGVIEDEEGLDAVALEYRINDAPPVKIERWLDADGRKQLSINNWLPLPSALKESDRFHFRLCASDNRRLKRGEIAGGDEVLPADDLMPHVVFAPAAAPGSEAWFEFRVERSAEDLLKEFAQAHADEIKGMIGKIKEKMQSESDQAKQLQRTIHQQAVRTPLQIQQSEKLETLNHEIAEDLLRAGRKFAMNPELAKLAEHFYDIADIEMIKSATALKQFRNRGRTLAEAEQDLQRVQDALAEARKKLDRMLDWNAMLAQDRLDRWQLEKLAKRQEELADRLAKMLAELPLSDAERAKEIEAIQREQAKLAEQTEKLQEQSRLVQDSAKAAEQMRLERLAKEAEQLAAEQRATRKLPPEKISSESKALKEKTDKLAADLLDLAQKGSSESKGMAKESAQAVVLAKKAMEASQAMKAKGATDEATKLDDDAGRQLDIAVKQLVKLAQDQAAKNMPKPDAEKTAEAIKDSTAQMLKAEEKLPKLPRDAQIAMKSAAQKLNDAARQASKQSARNLPKPMRDPAAKSSSRPGGASSAFAHIYKIELLDGKAWGELPGELKTQMLQDFRARYGTEYAEVIRQYFERLAQTPDRKE